MEEKNVKTEEMDLVVIRNPIMKRLISKAIKKPITKALSIDEQAFGLSVGDIKIEHDGIDVDFDIQLHGHIDSNMLYQLLETKGVI